VGLTLPSELTEPLGWIGLTWPQADEEKLFGNGQVWIDHGSKLRQQGQAANDAANSVLNQNSGESIDAFAKFWNGDDGPGKNLEDEAGACELIGFGLIVMAGITLAMKIYFIAQLIVLLIEVAQAIATAFASFGATMAEVPGFVAATRVFCKEALDKLIKAVREQIAKLFEQARNLFKNVKQLGKEGKALAKKFKEDPAKALAQLKKEFTGRGEYKRLMDEAGRADVHTPHDGANFYSGYDVANNKGMRKYAEENTDGVVSTTLEQTPGGRAMDDLHLYEDASPISQRQADRVWGKLSERYADGATGDVTAYVHNPREGNIFYNREVPALNENPNVTGIKVIDPVTGDVTTLK
jgi:hypothetical protein